MKAADKRVPGAEWMRDDHAWRRQLPAAHAPRRGMASPHQPWFRSKGGGCGADSSPATKPAPYQMSHRQACTHSPPFALRDLGARLCSPRIRLAAFAESASILARPCTSCSSTVYRPIHPPQMPRRGVGRVGALRGSRTKSFHGHIPWPRTAFCSRR